MTFGFLKYDPLKYSLGAALTAAALALGGAPASAEPASQTTLDLGYTSQSTEFSSQVYYAPRRRYYVPRYRYVRPNPYYYGYGYGYPAPVPAPYPYYAPRVYPGYGFYGRRYY